MPYIGFLLHDDPGPEKARRGKKKVRRRAVQCIPVASMLWRLAHADTEQIQFGWWLNGGCGTPPYKNQAYLFPPDKVIAVAPTSGRTLLVFYLCPWPDSPLAWPSIQF